MDKPIDMILHCRVCGLQHIDEPEMPSRNDFAYRMVNGMRVAIKPAPQVTPRWTNPPHRSHLCLGCGHIWRPADVPTNGVAEIKTNGKNDSPAPSAPPQFFDAKFLSLRLARVAKAVGVPMPDMSHEDTAAVAGTILGTIAGKLERAAQPSASFQFQVQPWMMACFGPVIAADCEERNHRFLEEALELVQACECTADEAHQLVDYVFNRPAGEPHQEVGGVMVTLAALCLAQELDMHEAGEVELARIWKKVEQIRAKQAAKPKHSPLPAVFPTTRTEPPQRMFPIQNGPLIPWTVIEPFDFQCKKNHGGQSLERIAQRGGLGVEEAIAVLNAQPYRGYKFINKAQSILDLQKLVADRLAASYSTSASGQPSKEADRDAALEEAAIHFEKTHRELWTPAIAEEIRALKGHQSSKEQN